MAILTYRGKNSDMELVYHFSIYYAIIFCSLTPPQGDIKFFFSSPIYFQMSFLFNKNKEIPGISTILL